VPQNAALFAYHNPDNGQGYRTVVLSLPQIGIRPAEADYRLSQSAHKAIIQVGLGDGSAHIVAAGISQQTWQNSITPDDSALLGSDW
jgi:hypothetical protein